MTEPTSASYPSNSHKARDGKTRPEPTKKIERVTESEAIQRKKPLSRKIAETFTGEDAKSAGMYILMDVLIPAAKNMISDAVSQGVERMLFGESRPRSSTSRSSYTSYGKVYSSSSRNEPRTISKRARATHDFGEIVLASRPEAEEVLDRLQGIIDQYDFATVSDLYELVGITGSFTDNKYGWGDLRGANVRYVRDGYLLDLPPTSPIN